MKGRRLSRPPARSSLSTRRGGRPLRYRVRPRPSAASRRGTGRRPATAAAAALQPRRSPPAARVAMAAAREGCDCPSQPATAAGAARQPPAAPGSALAARGAAAAADICPSRAARVSTGRAQRPGTEPPSRTTRTGRMHPSRGVAVNGTGRSWSRRRSLTTRKATRKLCRPSHWLQNLLRA